MKVKLWVWPLAACGAVAVSLAVLTAQGAGSGAQTTTCCAPAGADWPQVAANLGSQGYSELTQISKSNIANLAPAWVVHTNIEPVTQPAAAPGNTAVGQETTPIVVNGVMYLDTPGGGVIALNAATGEVKWKWMPSAEINGFGGVNQHRGVSVGEGKVFTTAAGNRVIALDQETGKLVWAVQPEHNGTPFIGVSKVHTLYHDGLIYMGTNDNARGAAFALRASDGAMAWVFYAAYPAGTMFTDVNGTTFDAGATWTTKETPNDTPNECYENGGGAPWMHPSIDPELGMLYVTFGNPRSCTGAQWGGGRPGDNLFTSSLVALDLKTGAYKWHFQSVRHDVWDMDNVHTPSLADVTIGGQPRKVIYYGSKSGHQFVLDRTNGKPALPIENREVPVDSRQAQPNTQPFPAQGGYMPQCLAYQNLGSEVPGLPNRAVPNWNGYQAQPDPANPGQYRLVLNPDNYLSGDSAFLSGPPRLGCMYDPHWEGESLFLSMTSQNGGNDWSNVTISPKLDMRFIPYLYNPVSHGVFQGGNGLRQMGGYQTGGLVAVSASTNLPVWRKEFGLSGDVAHGNSPLVTASDLLFINKIDGWLLAMDATTGEELWRFQTGFHSASGVITYMVNGEQYIAMPAMAGTQPYAQAAAGQGAAVWAFKLGGRAVYATGPRSNPAVVSGSQEAPAPPPIANLRRPVDNATWDRVPANTVYLAYQPEGAVGGGRGFGGGGGGRGAAPAGPAGAGAAAAEGRGGGGRAAGPGGPAAAQGGRGGGGRGGAPAAPAPAVRDSTASASMLPSRLTVPVGTTVTFTNPGDAQIGGPGTGNQKEHCATQYFEGLFNFRLKPGESAQYTFTREGEYYYNDCTHPRPAGKIIVTLAAENAPVAFTSNVLDFTSPTGLFTGVTGTVEAVMTVPAGWTLDQAVPVRLTAPLTTQTFEAASANLSGTRLTVAFNKADIDNNLPVGDSVPVKITANFLANGVQKKLEGTATVRVVK